MGLFLSTYVNRVDKKGRVSVPASFRAALSTQSFQGVVLFRSSTRPCLEGFAMDMMEEMSGRMDRLDLFSEEQDDWAASIFAGAQPLPFDGEGRILLTPDLMAHAGITELAAFAGMGRKFQIWNLAALDERMAEAQQNIKDRKRTLPKGGAAP